MKKRGIALTLLLLILISSVLYFFINNRQVKNEIIHNKIVKVKELATAKQIYREIIYSKKTRDIFWIPVTEKEFLISVDYSIIAGIDLSKGYQIVHKPGYTLVTLPRGEVLSIDALDSTIKEYYIKEVLTSIKRNDYFTPINESKESILESESIKELLIQCENNAREILKALLHPAGINIKVEFSEDTGDQR